MPRLDKWVDVFAWGGLTVITVSAATEPGYSVWSRAWRLAFGAFLFGTLVWKLCEKRRKRLARRQAELERLDLLVQREIRRRR
ncbi:hypothetical protein [Streptomyces sp. NPDC102360]|uniref:hypothetical protein n=1 Tax=Streptomyces sp. NPDC102360 TaxID=3366160 RepID=UPI0037F73E9F